MKRRTLLKLGLLQAGGSMVVFPVVGQESHPRDAFEATESSAVLTALHGTDLSEDSNQVQVDVPGIAQDPRYVPVRISSTLENIEAVTIIAEANDIPLSAHYRLYEPQDFLATRIKIEKTGDLLVIVKAGGKLYASRRMVRASSSGCTG